MNMGLRKQKKDKITWMGQGLVPLFLAIAMLCFYACTTKHEAPVSEPAKKVLALEDIANDKIAVLLGSVQDLKVSNEFPGKEDILRLTSMPELLVAVENNIADRALMDSVCLVGVDLQQRGLQVDFCLEENQPIANAFRMDEYELCAQFNTFIKEINENGTFQDMKRRWLGLSANNEEVPAINVPQEGPPIKVGTMSNDFPLAFLKGDQWCGLEVEMMFRFGEYVGRPIEFYDYEFGAMIPALNTGKIDVICCFLCITEERAKSVLFSAPYFNSVVTCVGRNPEYENKEDACFWTEVKNSFNNNLIVENRWKMLADGLYETLFISLFSIVLGTLMGIVICALRMSSKKVFREVAIIYTEILRGIPLLVFLMVMFYIVFATSRVTATWVAIIAFSMNFSVHVGNMLYTGIGGVDKGQIEAGRALGFSHYGTFSHFVVPQALRIVFPIYKGEAISLIKNTSIVGYIAIQDLTKASDIIRSRTFDAFFPLFVITIIYFLLAWLIGMALEQINKKISRR